MGDIAGTIKQIDWAQVTSELHQKGFTVVPQFLTERQCYQIINLYDKPHIYRKTVPMERYRFGLGEYKYFDYPLPNSINTLREQIYPKLVPIANTWMDQLNMGKRFPTSLQALQDECHANNQLKPTPLLLKYGNGGYNTLHQDLYGEVYFPIQTAIFLSQPDIDYTGGEFILTQQIPRSQSKASVLKPNKGDMIIFTTHFKPAKGVRGYYRVNMKHGVSEVHRGNRYTLGIIFHDAIS